jgi:hypothetical protein
MKWFIIIVPIFVQFDALLYNCIDFLRFLLVGWLVDLGIFCNGPYEAFSLLYYEFLLSSSYLLDVIC